MAMKHWIGAIAMAAIGVVAVVAKWQAAPGHGATDTAMRESEPPALDPLRGLPAPSSGALDLADVAPTGSARNRLRLRLPVGAGACTLTAEAPPENGHALVWKPRLGEHFVRGRLVESPPGTQTWELSTDDGRRQYFYGIEVATHLHCDGAPRWHHAAHDGDTPWRVDIGRLLGHRPDPDMPADRFFERTRFLNARGQPLRPMRRDAQADAAPGEAMYELRRSRLGDYMTPEGRIRFWGRVKAIRWAELSGQPIDRRWHTRLKDYE